MPVADGILSSTASRAFATFDPANKGAAIVLSGGNLTATCTLSGTNSGVAMCTLGKSTGKWYWEITIGTSIPHQVLGVGRNGLNLNQFLGIDSLGWGYTNDIGAPGQKVNGGSFSAYGATYLTTDVIMNAMDLDNGFIYWGKNGTWQNGGVPTSGGSGTGAAFTIGSGLTFFPAWSSALGPESATANFGATAFSFAVPSGYNAGVF